MADKIYAEYKCELERDSRHRKSFEVLWTSKRQDWRRKGKESHLPQFPKETTGFLSSYGPQAL